MNLLQFASAVSINASPLKYSNYGPLSITIVPTAPPQNVSGSALSSSLIMLQWSTPPPLDINGIIRHYTVSAVERHTGRQWTFFAIDPDLHVGSLHPFYYYDFNVSATTVGPGPFSSRYSILTDQERKPIIIIIIVIL